VISNGPFLFVEADFFSCMKNRFGGSAYFLKECKQCRVSSCSLIGLHLNTRNILTLHTIYPVHLLSGVSKSRYFDISISIKYSNFSRFYKKKGPFYKKFRCDKFGN